VSKHLVRQYHWKFEVLCFAYCSMWSIRWAPYLLINITNGSINVAKCPSSPRLSSRNGCTNQMWATWIMKELLIATSVVLAWLPTIRCEQQVSWGYWRMIILATSVVLASLPQSDLSNKDQRTYTLLQRMHSYQNLTKFLCKGFIIVLKDCT
jgi:hypothetical protein